MGGLLNKMEYRQNKLGSWLTTIGLLIVVAFGTVRDYKKCQRECEQITKDLELSNINFEEPHKRYLENVIKFEDEEKIHYARK